MSSALAATVVRGNRITRLDDGARFYPDMLAAIASAHRSIALECYIFHPGQIGDAFTEALVERAIAGVHVRIILDAIGSRRLRRRQAQRLTRAGCDLAWHPRARWRRAHRLTNSTHRELLVVDGRVAFTGGAGISDWWAIDYRGQPPWRDTMVRVEGPVVASCQAVFAENWLECRGDILAGEAWFPPLEACGTIDATVVKNSLSFAGSRALFQALIECATREIRLATPYFVPDPSFVSAFDRARAPGRLDHHPAAGSADGSPVGASQQPPLVPPITRRRNSAVRVSADDDTPEGDDRRWPVDGRRHDQPRHVVVRVSGRDQPRGA